MIHMIFFHVTNFTEIFFSMSYFFFFLIFFIFYILSFFNVTDITFLTHDCPPLSSQHLPPPKKPTRGNMVSKKNNLFLH